MVVVLHMDRRWTFDRRPLDLTNPHEQRPMYGKDKNTFHATHPSMAISTHGVFVYAKRPTSRLTSGVINILRHGRVSFSVIYPHAHDRRFLHLPLASSF